METLNLNNNLSISPANNFSCEEIQDWLISYLAIELKIDPQEIDPAIPFERYGLDSVVAVSLTGELEDRLGRQLKPTLPYDYPTIEALAEYLAHGEN